MEVVGIVFGSEVGICCIGGNYMEVVALIK